MACCVTYLCFYLSVIVGFSMFKSTQKLQTFFDGTRLIECKKGKIKKKNVKLEGNSRSNARDLSQSVRKQNRRVM